MQTYALVNADGVILDSIVVEDDSPFAAELVAAITDGGIGTPAHLADVTRAYDITDVLDTAGNPPGIGHRRATNGRWVTDHPPA